MDGKAAIIIIGLLFFLHSFHYYPFIHYTTLVYLSIHIEVRSFVLYTFIVCVYCLRNNELDVLKKRVETLERNIDREEQKGFDLETKSKYAS